MLNLNKPFTSAVISYCLWGLFPIYWYFLKNHSPLNVLSNRVVWSAIFISAYYYVFNSKSLDIKKNFRNYTLSAASLSVNWGVYIWAVNNGHVLASSMGYFLAPVFYVATGCLILKEKLSLQKLIAFTFCIMAIIPLFLSSQIITLAISVLLAVSIVFYAYCRKKGGLPTLQGLLLETLVMTPVAITYLIIQNGSDLICQNCNITEIFFLIGSGPVTLIPLLFFGYAVKSIPFNSMGFIQYISPILQFVVGVSYFQEPLNNEKLYAFVFVWLGMLMLLLPDYKFKKLSLT